MYSTGVKRSIIRPDGKDWKALIESFALLFDSLVDEDMPAKSALRKTAIHAARRAIRSVSGLLLPSQLGLTFSRLVPSKCVVGRQCCSWAYQGEHRERISYHITWTGL